MRTLKGVLRAGGFLLLLAALFVASYTAVSFALQSGNGTRAKGYSLAVVVSGSMSGAIEENDLIIMQAGGTYAVDDIITFEASDGMLITHRIVAQNEDGTLRTKGDANDAVDTAPVSLSQVQGRVIYTIPKVGIVVRFLQSPAGLIVAIALVLAMGYLLLRPGRHVDVRRGVSS